MSGRQLVEWMTFWELEGGFGEERMDTRFGTIIMTLSNINRSRKSGKRYTLKESTPRFGDAIGQAAGGGGTSSAPRKDWRWMKAMAKAMAEPSNERQG